MRLICALTCALKMGLVWAGMLLVLLVCPHMLLDNCNIETVAQPLVLAREDICHKLLPLKMPIIQAQQARNLPSI